VMIYFQTRYLVFGTKYNHLGCEKRQVKCQTGFSKEDNPVPEGNHILWMEIEVIIQWKGKGSGMWRGKGRTGRFRL